MYYQFGKTSNTLRIDKDNRLGLDINAIIDAGATYNNDFLFSFPQCLDDMYVALDQTITIDDITITNPNPSCFYNKLDMINWGVDLCCFNGKLVQNTEIIDFTPFFSFALDNNELVPVYNVTSQFYGVRFDNPNAEDTADNSIFTPKPKKINILQYLFNVPIVKLQIGDTLYDNHIFVLSKNYLLQYKEDFKLYIIKNS